MSEQKKKVSGLSIFFILLEIAFLAVVAARQYIFSPDSFFYNLYNEEVATNVFVRIVKTVVALAGGALIIKLAGIVTRLGENIKNNRTKTAVLLIGNILKYASAVGIVMISLAAWGIDTTAIATGAGVITLIVGLGCQSMISDVVSGIFILFEGDIQVGDIVVINGWRGTVKQIGLRRTSIEDSVGNINIINNSAITNVINNTKELSLAVCDVGIEYDESIVRVENVLRENFHRFKEEIPAIKEGPFYKGVASLGESSVNIRVIAKCDEQDKYQTERDINRMLKIIFDENNINIPFNQMVLSYREANTSTEGLTKEEIAATKKFIEQQRELSRNMEEQEG